METLDISSTHCTVERDGPVLLVKLNRPEKKNALSPAMLVGMYRAWHRLEEDDTLSCAILTAVGDTFCAGMDLKAGAEGDSGKGEIIFRRQERIARQLEFSIEDDADVDALLKDIRSELDSLS